MSEKFNYNEETMTLCQAFLSFKKNEESIEEFAKKLDRLDIDSLLESIEILKEIETDLLMPLEEDMDAIYSMDNDIQLCQESIMELEVNRIQDMRNIEALGYEVESLKTKLNTMKYLQYLTIAIFFFGFLILSFFIGGK